MTGPLTLFRLLTLVLLASAIGVPPSSAHASDVYLAAPTTVITAEGTAGLRLQIPSDKWDLREGDLAVTVQGGTFAYAALAMGPNCPAPQVSMCISFASYRLDTIDFSLSDDVSSAPLSAITYDVYIVTDGQATLTLNFQGTGGEETVSFAARDKVQATFERLPRGCLVPTSCDSLAYGGVTNEVSAPAYVTVISAAQHDTAGARSAGACLHPAGAGDDTSSSDPADYPYGCEAPQGETQQFLLFLATSIVIPNGFHYTVQNNPNPDGPVYAGFQGAAISPTAGGFDAYAVWLDGFEGTH